MVMTYFLLWQLLFRVFFELSLVFGSFKLVKCLASHAVGFLTVSFSPDGTKDTRLGGRKIISQLKQI